MSQLPPAGAGLCMPEGRPGRRQTRGRASGQGDQGQGRQGGDHGHRLADVLVRCGILGHPTQEALWVRGDGARGRHRNPGRSPRRHRRGTDQARLAGEEVGRLVPANKSLRGGRGLEAGVRGMPSPFINLDERGRHTPHPGLHPLVPMRKDFLDEVWPWPAGSRTARAGPGPRDFVYHPVIAIRAVWRESF
jgi:hypothetical protein